MTHLWRQPSCCVKFFNGGLGHKTPHFSTTAVQAVRSSSSTRPTHDQPPFWGMHADLWMCAVKEESDRAAVLRFWIFVSFNSGNSIYANSFSCLQLCVIQCCSGLHSNIQTTPQVGQLCCCRYEGLFFVRKHTRTQTGTCFRGC